MVQIVPSLAQKKLTGETNIEKDLEEARIMTYKAFTRVWSAYTKTLLRDVI